ncbi:hemicentin-1-like [Acanthaster planci]|uniref:Hemicentin-1-like n=1 Tax=Acanthaster planci TaxID=133434 RepID=A0A8B7ZYI3_ACAPL|nr:hemicentin-1-like [Acanthaster planci]
MEIRQLHRSLHNNMGRVLAVTITNEPLVTIGDEATVTCWFAGMFSYIRWSRSSTDVIDVTNTNAILEYRIHSVVYAVGVDSNHYNFEVSSGRYILTVKSVTLNDGGKYWCEIVELPPNPYTDDVAFTAFEIRVPPSSITVTYDYVQYNDGAVFSVVTGNDRHFTCSTPGVKPAATFSFKLLNVNTTEELQGTVLNSSNVQDNRLVDSSFFTTVDVTDIPATLQLSCDANNKPDGLNEAGIGAIVTIEVKVPPKTSQIAISDADGQDLVDGTAIVEQGRGHMFTCVVQGSRPAAEVRWFLGGVPQLLEVESSVDRNASNDLYDTSSNWTFIPTRNQHGLEVRCEASTADSVDPLPHTVIKLDVYGPPGFPTITGDKNMVEDMTTTLTCTADGGYPDDWNLVWYNRNAAFNMSTTTVSNSTNGRFMFTSVLLLTPNRADNEMNITCFAKRGSWSGDESSVWGPVNVRFCTSNVRVTDCPFVAVAGLDLTLSCVSETSNPPTTLVWLTDNDSNLTSPSNQSNYSVGGYGGTVTLQTYTTGILSVSNSGDVLQCCATNSALDYCSQNVCDSCALNVQLPAALTVTSEPWVTIRTDTTLACFGTEIDSRTLNSLTWLRSQVNNSDVHSATQLVKYTRGNLEFADGIDSNHYEFQTSNGIFTLTIKSVSLEDDGKYWCDIIESPPNPATEDTAYGVLRTRVPPTWVEITYDGVTYSALDTVSVVAGTNHMFSCWVPGVKPEANITLTLSEGNKTKQLLGNQTYRPNSDDSRLMDSCNTVYMSIAQSPAKSQLTCSATNTQDGSTNPDVYVIVKLSIKVPPGFPMLYDITGPLNTGTTVLVNQGETFNFTCEVLGTRPAASLDWYLNGVRQLATNQTTTLDDATELFDTMGVWTFIPGRADHKQEVKCEGTTAESQVPFPAAVVTLDVYGPPDSPTITGNTPLIEGVNTLLTCSADMGYPNDWILVWYTGEILQNNTITVATSSSDRYKFQSTLDFTPERDLNGKSIKCSAKRGSLTTGPDGGIGPVAVQFCAWTVSIVKYPLAVLEGSAASLTCTSESSNPAATLIWSKDGITLPTFTDHVVTDDVPMFILPVMPSSQTVNEGDNMTLTCIADANPKPNGFIIWEKFKDGKWTQVDVEDGETADGCSNLNLNVIARHQAGRYRCKADNGLHQDEYRKYSSSMTVIVYYEARISMKTPNHLVIKNGTDAVMSCTASGNPAPTIEWFSPSNASITNGTDLKKFLLESSTSAGNQLGGFEVSSVLTIIALIHQFDYGTYTCTTSNGVGQDDSLKLTITDTRIPDKPTNVEVVGRTSSSLVIRWRPAYDGGEDQTFLITHIKTSESPFLEVYSGQVDGDRSSFTIVGLESSTEYEIRVYGENSVGRNEDYGHTTGNTLSK